MIIQLNFRYRNFRTFTTPRPVQLSCVSVDYSGELVAAGGQDVFEIFLWSIKLGRLLEILSGHEGPVVSNIIIFVYKIFINFIIYLTV